MSKTKQESWISQISPIVWGKKLHFDIIVQKYW